MPPEDQELLSRYAQDRSEAAFSELVRRHINLVYAGALRRVGGDAHLAEDITQRVFTALARAAGEVAHHPVLAGWLHVTTRNLAAQTLRSERRRQAREREAGSMNETNLPEPAADWERLRPVIDEALDDLGDPDRTAVILRYFEGRPLAEVGAKLDLTENAARMRVDRALGRMQGFLARRGVTSTVGALSLALTSQAQVVAPVGLAATVSGAALAAAPIAATVVTFMSTIKIVAALSGTAAIAAVGVAWQQHRENQSARADLAASRSELATVSAHLEDTERNLEAARAEARAAGIDVDNLLAALDSMKAKTAAAAPAAAPVAVTADEVQGRFRNAQKLAREGNWEAALPELLWCYDEGMVRVSSLRAVRNSFLTSEIARMAANYPPAKAALEERRDAAKRRMLASARDSDAAMDFAALNAALGEDARNLAAFDQLPRDDIRRQGLLVRVYDQLVAAQRYTDAAEGRPFARMTTTFDAMTKERPLPAVANAENLRRTMRLNNVGAMAAGVEVLAGAGQVDNARLLMEKIIAYEDTSETRAVLQRHLNRAGHPELLVALPIRAKPASGP